MYSNTRLSSSLELSVLGPHTVFPLTAFFRLSFGLLLTLILVLLFGSLCMLGTYFKQETQNTSHQETPFRLSAWSAQP